MAEAAPSLSMLAGTSCTLDFTVPEGLVPAGDHPYQPGRIAHHEIRPVPGVSQQEEGRLPGKPKNPPRCSQRLQLYVPRRLRLAVKAYSVNLNRRVVILRRLNMQFHVTASSPNHRTPPISRTPRCCRSFEPLPCSAAQAHPPSPGH